MLNRWAFFLHSAQLWKIPGALHWKFPLLHGGSPNIVRVSNFVHSMPKCWQNRRRMRCYLWSLNQMVFSESHCVLCFAQPMRLNVSGHMSQHVELLKPGSVLCCISLEVLTCCLLSASPMPRHAFPSVPTSLSLSFSRVLPLDVPWSTGLDLISHSSFVPQTGCSAWRSECSA